ncbi:M56 family metallopeptidase [Paenibacillus alvei]|uniref:M56 family metallopeptidase n=1 Tax=Paenibacillus alvei TaxID=44250 RepID=UPI002379A0F4|nr:M56 family metallopeptidase [Paenibacillus alvei]
MSPCIHPTLLSVFGWVIRGSFMASILVVLVLILQFLLKNKLEARWKYLLWIPVAIRLLLPWAPESSLSLYNIVSLEAIVPGIHQQTQDPSAWREYWIDAGRKTKQKFMESGLSTRRKIALYGRLSYRIHLMNLEPYKRAAWGGIGSSK